MNVPSVEDSGRNGSMFGYTTLDFQTVQPDILRDEGYQNFSSAVSDW